MSLDSLPSDQKPDVTEYVVIEFSKHLAEMNYTPMNQDERAIVAIYTNWLKKTNRIDGRYIA